MHEEAVNHLGKADKLLARTIRRVGPCRLRMDRQSTPYESLVESIAYQQLTGKAAATIFGRVKALFSTHAFPPPEILVDTPDEILRGAGLSRAKVASVKDIARKTLDGVVPDRKAIQKLSDAEIMERLTSIRGVGPWTVEMLLMFRLGRPDVLPAADYGVQKGFARTYGWRKLPKPKELLAHGEKWRPYRTVASWYLWRILELPE